MHHHTWTYEDEKKEWFCNNCLKVMTEEIIKEECEAPVNHNNYYNSAPYEL